MEIGLDVLRFLIDYSTYPVLKEDGSEVVANNKKEFVDYIESEFGLIQTLLLSIITLKESLVASKIENQDGINSDEETQSEEREQNEINTFSDIELEENLDELLPK